MVIYSHMRINERFQILPESLIIEHKRVEPVATDARYLVYRDCLNRSTDSVPTCNVGDGAPSFLVH